MIIKTTFVCDTRFIYLALRAADSYLKRIEEGGKIAENRYSAVCLAYGEPEMVSFTIWGKPTNVRVYQDTASIKDVGR